MIPRKLISEQSWRRCVSLFLGACFGIVALTLAAVILIDPYDAGRFPTFMPAGTSTDLPSTLNVSRGRDPRFDAVATGDSRAVLIDAQRLSQGNSFRFVQMAVEGATMRDQALYLHWFARHHPGVRAIAMMVDLGWCERGRDFPHSRDFPAALYDDSVIKYLRATVNTTSLRISARRVSFALGWSPGIDPGRFVDIETRYPWHFDADPPRWHKATGAFRPAVRHLPAMRLVEEELAQLPAQPPMVLWTPPHFITSQPPPDTEEGRDVESCKASLRAWAEQRPHTAFLDFRIDSALTRERDNFLDVNHPRRRLAAVVEDEIAKAFAGMK